MGDFFSPQFEPELSCFHESQVSSVQSGTVGVQKRFIDMSELLSAKVSRISGAGSSLGLSGRAGEMRNNQNPGHDFEVNV